MERSALECCSIPASFTEKYTRFRNQVISENIIFPHWYCTLPHKQIGWVLFSRVFDSIIIKTVTIGYSLILASVAFKVSVDGFDICCLWMHK